MIIRDEKLYKERWDFSIREAQRLISSAKTIENIGTRPNGRLPTSESQTHPLSKLSDVREDRKMTRDERQKLIEALTAERKKLSEPIDFADLKKKGVLIKAGAWYRVKDPLTLPDHVTAKIREIAQDSKGIKVKIDKATKFEKLARKFGKLTK